MRAGVVCLLLSMVFGCATFAMGEDVQLRNQAVGLMNRAGIASKVNQTTENIGARRLHTILEKVLDELSFDAPDLKKKAVKVDAAYVNKQLADIVKNQDLSRYIL